MEKILLLFLLFRVETSSLKVAVLYHTFEGQLQERPLIEDELREYFESGEVNFIRFLITRDNSIVVAKN